MAFVCWFEYLLVELLFILGELDLTCLAEPMSLVSILDDFIGLFRESKSTSFYQASFSNVSEYEGGNNVTSFKLSETSTQLALSGYSFGFA